MAEKQKSWFKKHPVWTGIIGFVVLAMIIGPFLPGDKQESNEGSLTLLETGNQDNDCNPNWQCSSWSICSSSSKQTRTCSDNNNCGVLTNKPAVSQSCTPSVEEKSDKATIGEKNALSKALSYLSIMPFSYSGLIEQLEYEGYTHQEAVYGVDNSGADWNEQAALKAQSYLDIMPFSREGLIEQLEYEGYTREQAEYGVQAVGY